MRVLLAGLLIFSITVTLNSILLATHLFFFPISEISPYTLLLTGFSEEIIRSVASIQLLKFITGKNQSIQHNKRIIFFVIIVAILFASIENLKHFRVLLLAFDDDLNLKPFTITVVVCLAFSQYAFHLLAFTLSLFFISIKNFTLFFITCILHGIYNFCVALLPYNYFDLSTLSKVLVTKMIAIALFCILAHCWRNEIFLRYEGV